MRPKWLLRKPWPCKPSQTLSPAAAAGPPPPAFGASPALIRPIGFTSSHPLPQLKSGGRPGSGLPMCDDCEPRRDSPYSSIGMSVAPAELLSSDETLTASSTLIESKRGLQPSTIPFSTIPAHLPTVGNHWCVFAHLIHSLPSNCSSTLYETLLSNRRLLSRSVVKVALSSQLLMFHLFILMW